MIIRLSIYDIDTKISDGEKLYLEEDCSGFLGSHFKKGKELLESDVKKLYKHGYNILWVNDGKKDFQNEKYAKLDNYIYEKKQEIEAIVGRGISIIDESQVRKPESTLKIFDGDDLLKQAINALQKDGARIVLKNLYGDRGKKILPLKSLLNKIYKEDINTFGIFDNISVGNIHLKKKSKKIDKKDIENTNFYLKTSVVSGIAFLITLNNIMKKRNPKYEGIAQAKINPRKRPPYSKQQLIDNSFASSFADMGFIHIIIDNNIKKLTTSLFNEDGSLIDNGAVELDERIKNILDRHTNVISHILESDRSDPPLLKEEDADTIKQSHRGLNGAGYPKRNVVTETVTRVVNEETNETKLEVRSLFDSEFKELPRLLGIINLFAKLLLGTPWRLPVERDMLVRYFRMNSQYPYNPDAGLDTAGEWDFILRDIYEKRFDAYLLDEFLKSIYLYKLGEKIPIYDISNPEEVRFDAVVVGYTDQPNRPVVEIKEDGSNKKIDLSKEEFEHYYIGEYSPAVKLKAFLEVESPKFSDLGVYLNEDLFELETYADAEEPKKNLKKNKELDKAVDNIFGDDGPEIDDLSKKASDDDVNALLAQFMPPTQDSNNKKEAVKETSPAENNNNSDKATKTIKKEPLTGLFDDDDYIDDEDIMEDLNYIYKLSDSGIKELYGFAVVKKKKDGIFGATLTHTAIKTKNTAGAFVYKILKIHPKHRDTIIIYENPKSKTVPVGYVPYIIGNKVDKDKLLQDPHITISDTYMVGEFFFLNYVAELDPKKNPDYKNVDKNKVKGIPAYIVRVIKKTDNPIKPAVKFYHLFKRSEKGVSWVKDGHFGKDFDLRKVPFFILGRRITTKELASVMGIK